MRKLVDSESNEFKEFIKVRNWSGVEKKIYIEKLHKLDRIEILCNYVSLSTIEK